MSKRPVNRLLRPYISGSGSAKALDTPKQLKHILFVASQGDLGIRNVAIMWMLFGSGLRINEVAQLKVKNVLDKSGELLPRFVIPAAYTKTNKARLVYLYVPSQRKALGKWLKHRQETNGMLSGDDSYLGLRPDSGLFLAKKGNWREFAFNNKKYQTLDGEKITKVCSSLENLTRDIIKSAGIQGGSSHSGRTTLATWFYRHGFSLKVIMDILGHESEEMSLSYVESDDKVLRNAYKLLCSELKI